MLQSKLIKITTFFFLFALSLNLFSSEQITKENLFEYLNEKQFLNTKFIQITIKNLKERVARGSLMATRTGKFKIEYLDPIREVISADKSFLYKLDLELDQMDVVPREDYFNNTPVSIFIEQLDGMKNLYSVDSCIKDEETIMCSIKPNDDESFVSMLFLEFLKNDLISLRYQDSFGQTVKLKFEDLSWKPFSESELLISIPEGIDVVYH